MSFVLTNYGEEWKGRAALQDIAPTSVDIGLYNDSTDALGEGSDVGDLTSEPNTGGDYSRHTVTAPSNFTFTFDGSNNFKYAADNQTFNVSSNSQTVDAYFLVINFQATTGTLHDDAGATNHLVLTGALSQSRNLDEIDNLQVNEIGGTID